MAWYGWQRNKILATTRLLTDTVQYPYMYGAYGMMPGYPQATDASATAATTTTPATDGSAGEPDSKRARVGDYQYQEPAAGPQLPNASDQFQSLPSPPPASEEAPEQQQPIPSELVPASVRVAAAAASASVSAKAAPSQPPSTSATQQDQQSSTTPFWKAPSEIARQRT